MKRQLALALGLPSLLLLGGLYAQKPGSMAPADSGREMYRAYCASCHGLDGKGYGPVARALKAPPIDLTTLSRRHGGKFPEVRVFQTIEGSAEIAAHGTADMPVWGTVFRLRGGSDEAVVKLRVRNLTRHLESLQQK